jgi:hypothetical protein
MQQLQEQLRQGTQAGPLKAFFFDLETNGRGEPGVVGPGPAGQAGAATASHRGASCGQPHTSQGERFS